MPARRGRSGNSPEPPFAREEIGDRRFQEGPREIRPHHIGEKELGIRGFPEEKIGEPLFSTGADEQVDRGDVGPAVIDLCDELPEPVAVETA